MSKKKTTTPKPKAADEPILLQSFGLLSSIHFKERRCFARVKLTTPEISRLIKAMHRFAIRKGSIPNPKVLDALDTLEKYFCVGGRGPRINIHTDVVVCNHPFRFQVVSELLPLDDDDAPTP